MRRPFAYTYLTRPDCLFLEVAGTRLPVVHFSAHFGKNEIPQAQCFIALGMQARAGGLPSPVHKILGKLEKLSAAKVVFRPLGAQNLFGDPWPSELVVFDGLTIGYATRKSMGKVSLVVSLVHWLVNLTLSSCLSRNSHPSNPASYTAAAVLTALPGAGADGLQPAYTSGSVIRSGIEDEIREDLWGAIKKMFCGLAAIDTAVLGPADACAGSETWRKNDLALDALKRIEGPATDEAKDAALAYKRGVALTLESVQAFPEVAEAAADAIGMETIASFAGTTFWDKLVLAYCPSFQMAVVPMVGRALVVADCPAYDAAVWRTITVHGQASVEHDAVLDRPLRAVGLQADFEAQTGSNDLKVPLAIAGGCYVDERVSAQDGQVLFVAPPPWLSILVQKNGADNGASVDVESKGPTSTATSPRGKPGADPQGAGASRTNANDLYRLYAKSIYVQYALRGRHGGLAGPLRFDIAPGSNVEIQSLGASPNDPVSVRQRAHVARVSVVIDAEAQQAHTAFELTHIRTAEQNASGRASVQEHPLFGLALHGGDDAGGHPRHGAPLIDDDRLKGL